MQWTEQGNRAAELAALQELPSLTPARQNTSSSEFVDMQRAAIFVSDFNVGGHWRDQTEFSSRILPKITFATRGRFRFRCCRVFIVLTESIPKPRQHGQRSTLYAQSANLF